MKIFENYNSARQKYGAELVETLTQNGLPPQFLLSACRFISENDVPQQRIVSLFKEWIRYVVKFNNTDVNKLSYEQFYNSSCSGIRVPIIIISEGDSLSGH